MSKFFCQLLSENLIADWVETLDWLFDDLKFSKERNWNRGYTSSFTKKLKRAHNFQNNDKRFICGKFELSAFPNQINGSRHKRSALIMMINKDSIAKDLIRHIRNGIAHGQATIYKVGTELYIEILDFSDKSRSPSKQTAFICVPLSYVVSFHKIYQEINKSIMNTKPADRKQRKMQGVNSNGYI